MLEGQTETAETVRSSFPDFGLRPATQEDVSFIMATWKRNQRGQGDYRFLTNRIYFDVIGQRISRIIGRPSCRATVITSPEAGQDYIVGYVVHELIGPVFTVHFAYVKRVFQGMGLMTLALKRIYPRFLIEEVAITHITDTIAPMRARYLLKFNPAIHERRAIR